MTDFLFEYRNIFSIYSFVLAIEFLLYMYLLSFKVKAVNQSFMETSSFLVFKILVIGIMFFLFDIEVSNLFPLVSSLYSLLTLDVFIILGFYLLFFMGLLYEINPKVLAFQTSAVICLFFTQNLMHLSFLLLYFNFRLLALILIIYSFFNLFSYILLYHKIKRNISILSYIFYSINLLIFNLYLYSIYFTFTFDHKQKLLYSEIPLSLTYRYILYCICVCITIFLYFLILKRKNLQIFTLLKIPYLQEEMRLILKGLWDNSLGSACIYLSNYMIKSKYFRFTYFSIHFVSVILVRFIMLSLFFNFIFFSSNFFLLLYMAPFSFMSWVLNNLFYYHFWVIEGNKNYIQACLSAKIKNNSYSHLDHNYIAVFPNDLNFKITNYGLQEGYKPHHYPKLVSHWLTLTSLDVSLNQYKKKVKIFSLIIFSIYFYCWFYISIDFFSNTNQKISLLVGNGFWGHKMFSFIKRSLHSTTPLHAPFDARLIRESVMNDLRLKTNLVYYAGHPIYGEILTDGSYVAHGMLTTKPQTKNPNIVPAFLCKQRVDGKPGDQYYIEFDSPIIIKSGDFSPSSYGNSKVILASKELDDLLRHIFN